MTQAAKDYRVDPYLHEACQDDAEAHCKGTKPENGQVQACLVSACKATVCESAFDMHYIAVVPETATS